MLRYQSFFMLNSYFSSVIPGFKKWFIKSGRTDGVSYLCIFVRAPQYVSAL